MERDEHYLGAAGGTGWVRAIARMYVLMHGQDLPEVEEWNEYGEIKDNLSFSSTATQSASTTSTPSKPPPTASTSTPKISSPSKLATESTLSQPSPSSPTQPSTSATSTPAGKENSMTAQMRQLGIEAAQKASDAKSKAKTSAPEPSNTKSETLQKLDNSGPPGMPPPSGTTEAEQATAPETVGVDVASKADETPMVGQERGEVGEEERAEVEHPHGTLGPAVAGTGHTGEGENDTKALEEHGGLEPSKNDRTSKADNTEEDNEDDEAEAQEMKARIVHDATASKEEELPGKKTQDQGAAEGEESGVSVGD